MRFDSETQLVEGMKGASVLYNTYWVRFDHVDFNHDTAVKNTRALFRAAKSAGIERIVHVSITNPDITSNLPYFRGKAELENDLRACGLSYAIVRPTVIFGKEDILINNIAWLLRRFPVFGVFGDGSYQLQPIYVDDLAALMVQLARSSENSITNAIGPETFSFLDLVRNIGKGIGCERPVLKLPARLAKAAGDIIGMIKHDVTITKEEIEGLMANLLLVDSEPTGTTLLSEWIQRNSQSLGARYSSELARRNNRELSYSQL